MRTLTFATAAEGYFPILKSSAKQFGYDLNVLGWGVPWPGSAARMRCYRDELDGVPVDEIVMIVDAYDAFFLAPAAEAEARFREMRSPYLLSAQRYFPKNAFMRRQADQVMGLKIRSPFRREVEDQNYGRPCMGALLGFAGSLVKLFSRLLSIEAVHTTRHDQILVNLYLQENPGEAFIDRNCQVFQSLWRTRRPFPLRGAFDSHDKSAEVRVLPTGRVENRMTGTQPQVIHGPFDLDMDALAEELGYELGGVHRVSGAKYFQYSIRSYVRIFFRRWFNVIKRVLQPMVKS